MAGFNKILLMGNLTRDPQLSYTPNQTAVVEFGLAMNSKWTGKDGEAREETCFVDCRAFGRQAENINKYLTKGRPVFVEGRLTFDSWTAQDGTKRSKHRVTVQNCQFLPSTSTAGTEPPADQAEQGTDENPSTSQPGGRNSAGQIPRNAGNAPDAPADDIPF
ncbi:MAG: single-stranded DNA-binding protein [Sedimentisphaerales bacterium]|jgi:single-strand DNA-binding protein|nr:single-stranded DNA-binding protein [Sedimentisphaerales bacterium]